MKIHKILIFIVIFLIILTGSLFVFKRYTDELKINKESIVKDFYSCVEAGYPIIDGTPRQCKTIDGQTFEEKDGIVIPDEEPIESPIVVITPVPNETITSPLKITGEARGTWYFEASFPITLIDAENNIIVQHYAQAQDEWMTEDFVPFESTLTFVAPQTEDGYLILHKDNPSGLPENDDQIIIPIKF